MGSGPLGGSRLGRGKRLCCASELDSTQSPIAGWSLTAINGWGLAERKAVSRRRCGEPMVVGG